MKSARNILHLGLDVHKESIAVAIAAVSGLVRPDGEITARPLHRCTTVLKKRNGTNPRA
jgi:hypothetical protein